MDFQRTIALIYRAVGNTIKKDTGTGYLGSQTVLIMPRGK